MSIILNFAALRPAVATEAPALTLANDSDFQRRLSDAASGNSPLDEASALAREFAQTSFVRSVDEVAYGRALASAFARLRGDRAPSLDQATAAIDEALRGASTEAFAEDFGRAQDTVVAAYLLADGPNPGPAQALVRMYSLARAVLTGSPTVEALESMLRGPMALPDAILGLRRAPAPAPTAPAVQDTPQAQVERINALAERHRQLSQTLEAIDLHAEDELVLSELGEARPLGSLYTPGESPAQRAGPREETSASRKLPMQVTQRPDAPSPLLRAAARQNVVLSSKAVELLPGHAAATLRSLDLDPRTAPLAEMRGGILSTKGKIEQELTDLANSYGTTVGASSFAFADPSWFVDPVDAPDVPLPVSTAAPTTHSDIKPLGVADLLLVRAHISHYERSEVASIENILAHEKLTHSTRRLDTSEDVLTTEREVTDLRSQTQGTSEQDNWHTTVQAVGPGVGPLAAEGPASFAQSVTDQVSSSSTNRTRRLAVERRLRESEDRMEHLIDNAAGAAGLYGVYQWLDKIYTAQIFTYGSRLLYDIVAPEPAAMFREALARPRSGLPLPVRPAKFTVAPTKLTARNWAHYAAGNHASGVDAPPASETVVTEPFAGHCKDPFSSDSATNTLVMAETRATRIPKGYRAARYRVKIEADGYNAGILRAVIGSQSFTIAPAPGYWLKSGELDDETETIPVGVTVNSDGVNWGLSSIAIGVEIICEATDELMAAWQVKAHGAILEANRRRFDEYEEAIATRDASARVFLQSLPPGRKVSIVQTEMKRAALEVLTGQSFAGFNAMKYEAMAFPYPDPAATAGLSAYIRFFEQAVEWEHLAYAFYPYFWGAQTSWVSKLLANESDPQFAGFLTSGAARIVLPIRRGYEAAFERFLKTGLTPTTAELLDAGSPLWVSLVDELRHQAAEDWTETAVEEPWQFRIASDLIRARTDGSMPKWALAAGEWKDASDPAF